jgi:hypothetical protein
VRRDYDDHRYSEYRGGCLPRRVVRARLERRGAGRSFAERDVMASL